MRRCTSRFPHDRPVSSACDSWARIATTGGSPNYPSTHRLQRMGPADRDPTSRMTRRTTGTLLLISLTIILYRGPLLGQGAGRGGGAQAPRGRSITLGDVTAFDVKDNIATVSAGQDQ